MALDGSIRDAARRFGALGRGFMMNPYSGQRGDEIGLDFFGFYVLGRAGVLGDVDGKTVADAFYFFHPDTLSAVWEGAKAKATPQQAAEHYALACADWGRQELEGIEDLDAFCAVADKVVAAAEPTPSAALFAGWREVDLPSDAPGRAAMHITLVLREHRGGAHVDAIKEAGISPELAVAANTPGMFQIFGWTGDMPDPADAADRIAAAEDRTDELVAPAYAGLDDGERAVFAKVIEAIGSKIGQ